MEDAMKRIITICFIVVMSISAYAQIDFSWERSGDQPIITPGVYPNAVKVGDTWHLFYDAAIWHQRVKHAISNDDGQTWTDLGVVISPGQNGFNFSDVSTGTVMYEDGQFHFYYSACYQAAWDVFGYATSPDGNNWINHGIILQRGLVVPGMIML